MSTESGFKIEYDYQNPENVEAEVPSSQKLREGQTTDLELSTETADGAAIDLRNGSYSVTKRSYKESRGAEQGITVTRTVVTLSAGSEDIHDNQGLVMEEKPKTKIPKLKFRQAAERVRAERKQFKETEKSKEKESYSSTRRSSIPKLTRVSKIPPPTTKPIVTKREANETVVTTKADDDFEKIYEEIIEYTDVTGDLTDPEKVDSEFEEIIHAYDEKKVQTPIPKVRQSKIPSLRRKSEDEIEVQKSSTRFAVKSKVRSIPRLKEISMRTEEDNNGISQVVRQYSQTISTDKVSADDALEDNNRMIIDDTGGEKMNNLIKTTKMHQIASNELHQKEKVVGGDGKERKIFTKTSKITKLMKSKIVTGSENLPPEELKTIEWDGSGTKNVETINKITKVIKTTHSPDYENYSVQADVDNVNGDSNKTTSTIGKIIKTGRVENIINTNQKDIAYNKFIDDNTNNNIMQTTKLTKVVTAHRLASHDDDFGIEEIKNFVDNKDSNDRSVVSTITTIVKMEKDDNHNNISSEEHKAINNFKLINDSGIENIEKTSKLTKIRKPERLKQKHEDIFAGEIRTVIEKENQNTAKTVSVITKTDKIDKNNNSDNENQKETSSIEMKNKHTTTNVKTEKCRENYPNSITGEQHIYYDNDGKNIVKTSKFTKVTKTENFRDDFIANEKKGDISTNNRMVSIESKRNTDNNVVTKSTAQAENISKTFVKVGVPVYNKQVSEISTGINTQKIQIRNTIKRSTSEGVASQIKTVTENETAKVKSDEIPIINKNYTITHGSSNSDIEEKNQEDFLREIDNIKTPAKDRNVNIDKNQTLNAYNIRPEVTMTVTSLVSSYNDAKKVENKKDMYDDITKVERNASNPLVPKFEQVSTKESSTIDNEASKNDENRVNTYVAEQESQVVEDVELRGKVGRLINKIDANKLNLTDSPKIDLSEELPMKKSVLSKIAMFESHDINEPMPRRKPRPEKIFIKEMPQEKSVHVHTPKIVEEVLKTKDIDDQPDTDSLHDPFLTYKPLYDHLKTVEINRSTEYLDTKIEAPKTLDIKTPDYQIPPSPMRKSIESKVTTNKLNTSNLVIDAPVILISPKIDVKKNINLYTYDNTAEFAKTAVSTMQTKNLEVSTPIQVNIDYGVSKVDLESSKTISETSDSTFAFKDVKKNIAIYENFGNTNNSSCKKVNTNFVNYTEETNLNKGTNNSDVKIREQLKYESAKPINEIIISNEDTKYEDVKPINEVSIEIKEAVYENITPINETITLKEDIKYENVKPISNIMTTNDEVIYDIPRPLNPNLISKEEVQYEQIRPISKILTSREEIIFKKARPVSEIIGSSTDIQYEHARPISQILTAKDENNYEMFRPISEVVNVKEDTSSKNVKEINENLQCVNRRTINRITTSRHGHFHGNVRVINEVMETGENNEVFSYETHTDEDKPKTPQSKKTDDDIRRAKSLAELDLGDSVKGKVNNTILRMKSVDIYEVDRKEIMKVKQLPRLPSVSEKIALFESKATAVRSDSVFVSCRSKTVRTRTVVKMSEEEYLQKIEDLSNAKNFGSVAEMPTITLAGGAKMPVLSVGTALIDPKLTKHVVSAAIDLGYRCIDAAYIYGNEKEIGEAIREKIADGTVEREDLFIVNKLWSTFHRPDLVVKACQTSLDAMGLTYFDLYLIHNPMSFKEGDDPVPKIATVLQYSQHDYLDAWYGMEQLVAKGLVKNIGVSNFNSVQIQRILDKGKVKPVVNQVESHPYLTQQRLHGFCAERNIVLSCFGVLGSKGTPEEHKSGVPAAIDDPLVQVMASGLQMTPAQLLIRYQIQCERSVVVKSSSGTRLWENIKALNYTLTPGQVDALHALNKNKRIFTFSGMGDTHKNYPFKIAF